MHKSLYAMAVLLIAAGVLFWAERPGAVHAPSTQLSGVEEMTVPSRQGVEAAPPAHDREPSPVAALSTSAQPPAVSGPSAPPAQEPVTAGQFVSMLTHPQSTYSRRQEIWKTVLAREKVDEVIAELERRTVENPQASADFAALGHAYFAKAGMTQEFTERSALGLKIDETLDKCLKLDPSNWEARFDKTTSMSYWPSFLGKDKQVVEEFLALIQSQESQKPEPHFALTYLKLGEQYQKLGRADYASEIWRRGAELFPDNAALRKVAPATGSP